MDCSVSGDFADPEVAIISDVEFTVSAQSHTVRVVEPGVGRRSFIATEALTASHHAPTARHSADNAVRPHAAHPVVVGVGYVQGTVGCNGNVFGIIKLSGHRRSSISAE